MFLFSVRSIAILSILFVCSFIAVIIYLSRYPTEVAEAVGIEDAQAYTRALSSFRTLYTSLVVEPARDRGVEITHDIFKGGNSMPLPATMTRLIGEEIGKAGRGGEAYLYSPYPFPWQKNGGLRDRFAQDAWEALNKNPDKPFSRFEDIAGVRTLRYASADIMRESCVGCHNAHPQSPRVGWKVGDVRGILEVRRPVGNVFIQASSRAENIFWMVASIGVLGVIALVAMAVLIRNLKLEMTGREKAELLIRDQQALLVESSKMAALGEMAGGIAHEINTPLAIMSLKVEQMEGAVKKGDFKVIDVLAGFELLKKTTARISKIIVGLRSFAREDRQALPQKVKISTLVEDTLSFCSERLAHHDIKLTVEKNDTFNLLEIECRAVEISQVILNLLNNACDALEPLKEKWIRISATDAGDYVQICVTDSGTGIPKEIQNKIMQPFFTTKDLGKGTGIGLSISKGIVESHAGKFFLDNTSANTKFVILLPKKHPKKH